jgi:hypothetical protein
MNGRSSFPLPTAAEFCLGQNRTGAEVGFARETRGRNLRRIYGWFDDDECTGGNGALERAQLRSRVVTLKSLGC